MYTRENYLADFKEAIDKMFSITSAKNSDYGGQSDPFKNFEMVDKLGITDPKTAILVRMTDKLARISTLLSGQKQQVKDESIEDTLLDLANYAVILKIYYNRRKQTSSDAPTMRFESTVDGIHWESPEQYELALERS